MPTGSVIDYMLEPLPIEHELDDLVEQAGQGLLRLDFRQVEFLTSMVLAKLVSIDKQMKNSGGSLQIVNVNAKMYEVFRVTDLHLLLDLTLDVATAEPPAAACEPGSTASP